MIPKVNFWWLNYLLTISWEELDAELDKRPLNESTAKYLQTILDKYYDLQLERFSISSCDLSEWVEKLKIWREDIPAAFILRETVSAYIGGLEYAIKYEKEPEFAKDLLADSILRLRRILEKQIKEGEE